MFYCIKLIAFLSYQNKIFLKTVHLTGTCISSALVRFLMEMILKSKSIYFQDETFWQALLFWLDTNNARN